MKLARGSSARSRLYQKFKIQLSAVRWFTGVSGLKALEFASPELATFPQQVQRHSPLLFFGSFVQSSLYLLQVTFDNVPKGGFRAPSGDACLGDSIVKLPGCVE